MIKSSPMFFILFILEDQNYEVHANTKIVNKKPLILGETKRERNKERIKSGKTAKIKIEETGHDFTDIKGSIDQSLDGKIDSLGQKRLDSFANDQRVMSSLSVDMKSIAEDVSNQSANSFNNNNNLVIRDSVKQIDYKSNDIFTTEMTPIPDTNLVNIFYFLIKRENPLKNVKTFRNFY